MDRVIFHCDLNCFYASVELLSHPELRHAKKEAISMKHAISSDTSKKLEKYISEIFNLDGLECNYDEKSEKCQKCIKITAKNRMKKKENKKC